MGAKQAGEIVRIIVLVGVAMLCALALLSMGGCAGPALNEFDQKIETERMTAKTACHQAKSAGEAARMQVVAKLPQDQQALMLAMEAMRGQAEALSGKDPCATGLNAHEARVAIAKSQNDTIGNVVPGVAGIGGMYGVAHDGFRAASKLAERAGSQTTNNIQGDGNDTSNTHVSTVSDVSNDISADGEGAAPSVSNGSTTGPDMSAPVTTTNNGLVPEGSTLAGAAEAAE